jgi:hypothetical protein
MICNAGQWRPITPGSTDADPDTAVYRDINGRIKAANPAAGDDVDTKGARNAALAPVTISITSASQTYENIFNLLSPYVPSVGQFALASGCIYYEYVDPKAYIVAWVKKETSSRVTIVTLGVNGTQATHTFESGLSATFPGSMCISVLPRQA